MLYEVITGLRVAQKLDITAQGEWNDLSYVGRPDRQINPRGALRVAHRDFGGHISYRPLRVTDALGVTTRQRETTFNGYVNRAGWPRLNASYVRRRQLAQGLMPEATGVRRTIAASHEAGPFQLRITSYNVCYTKLLRSQSSVVASSLP